MISKRVKMALDAKTGNGNKEINAKKSKCKTG
jgi:hypothetical protein